MDRQEILRRKAEIEERYGEWVSHSIKLADGIYTMPPESQQRKLYSLHRFVQIVSDVMAAPLEDLRVLDLACLEGLYAVEFALRGSRVVGIEGRRRNIEKTKFAKEVLGLANLELFEDDVRNLSEEKYGRFDVVLCCGLLYHLDAPDLFEFMERVSSVCDRVLLLDTHFSLRAAESVGYNGRTYYGWRYTEFPPTATREEKDSSPLSSLDNNESFWLTRPSLWNLIKDVGFTTAYLCVNPATDSDFSDRDSFIALKGRRQTIRTTPLVNDFPPTEWPEQDGRRPQGAQAAALRAAEPPSPRPNVLTRAVRRVCRAVRARLT